MTAAETSEFELQRSVGGVRAIVSQENGFGGRDVALHKATTVTLSGYAKVSLPDWTSHPSGHPTSLRHGKASQSHSVGHAPRFALALIEVQCRLHRRQSFQRHIRPESDKPCHVVVFHEVCASYVQTGE